MKLALPGAPQSFENFKARVFSYKCGVKMGFLPILINSLLNQSWLVTVVMLSVKY